MHHPLLYQLNTRILLGERSRRLGRETTLDDLDDAFLDRIAALGFEWLWPLGVWQTGAFGREVSRSRDALRRGYAESLPDVTDADVTGSPFAVQAYQVHRDFGGDPALARLRTRLARRGLKLLLDFVPNHVAPDHPWVRSHPEYFVHGTEADLEAAPENWMRMAPGAGRAILAHGRDPYFPGWPDTLQLDYRRPEVRRAQLEVLQEIATRCDGVRCDMAMLVEPDVFSRTWGPLEGADFEAPFWPEAIREVREVHPGFLFMAEVYWDLEWRLQQEGFDYTYDKRLYDRLVHEDAEAVRGHLRADPAYQDRSVRFLENHDEPRAAATFPPGRHEAAATISYLVPGLRFFHEGQLEGRRVRASMHLGRRPAEARDPELARFYEGLLAVLRRAEVRDGAWRTWEPRPAWDGNESHRRLLVFTWTLGDRPPLLGVVNFGDTPAQGYVTFELPALAGRRWRLTDLLGEARYEREGDGLTGPGLYLDVPPWAHQVFALEDAAEAAEGVAAPRRRAGTEATSPRARP